MGVDVVGLNLKMYKSKQNRIKVDELGNASWAGVGKEKWRPFCRYFLDLEPRPKMLTKTRWFKTPTSFDIKSGIHWRKHLSILYGGVQLPVTK